MKVLCGSEWEYKRDGKSHWSLESLKDKNEEFELVMERD